MQVPWYAVLGNHDYGDGIAPGDPQPRCREGAPPWKCSAGPLTQVAEDHCTWSTCGAAAVRTAWRSA